MNDFNVSLKIEDCIYSCNCKNCNSSTDTITRNVRNFPMQICIPTKGCTHIVTLTATIN